jgi:hypothetical protein
MDEPAPYPEPEPGTRIRAIPFPVGNPDRTPKPREPVTGRDGVLRGHLTGLPVSRPAPCSPDEQVHDWTPWPPP